MDKVTLITRPRRFGKTLNMSMVEQFFSVDYAGQGRLFEQMKIWEEETYRQIQGTPAERIRKYGFAFEGKCVLIGAPDGQQNT